jgi:hypothetical protein
VDEIIIDPHYPNALIIKDRTNYYIVHINMAEKHEAKSLPHYRPYDGYDRMSENHEFALYGMAPRGGFKPLNIGRAATEAEFSKIVKKYELTDDDVSAEFSSTLGEAYGSAKEVIKVRQIHIHGTAIPVENEIRESGIYAFSGSPGRVNIRVA